MSAVERRFPAAAEFLAAERGEGPAPLYGPTETQNVHDDQPEPHVVVRVDFQLSRFELFALLADGYATTNVDRSPDGMTVEQVRSDVESACAGTSSLELDALVEQVAGQVEQVAGQVERGEHAEQMQALRRAMDRAYPLRWEPEPRPVQQPEYGAGTVTVTTLDYGRITIDEPAWCAGHDGEQIVQRVDVTHVGARVAAEHAGVEFLPACISWAPFAELRPEPYPLADVAEFPGMDPEQLRELAAEVGLHAGRLYSKANELDRLRREGSS